MFLFCFFLPSSFSLCVWFNLFCTRNHRLQALKWNPRLNWMIKREGGRDWRRERWGWGKELTGITNENDTNEEGMMPTNSPSLFLACKGELHQMCHFGESELQSRTTISPGWWCVWVNDQTNRGHPNIPKCLTDWQSANQHRREREQEAIQCSYLVWLFHWRFEREREPEIESLMTPNES